MTQICSAWACLRALLTASSAMVKITVWVFMSNSSTRAVSHWMITFWSKVSLVFSAMDSRAAIKPSDSNTSGRRVKSMWRSCREVRRASSSVCIRASPAAAMSLLSKCRARLICMGMAATVWVGPSCNALANRRWASDWALMIWSRSVFSSWKRCAFCMAIWA